ncbi:hypothetical protein [Paracoccus siganidrum]|uniref:hypothetical protein n=1 Tax=Paracoccus siganidrum TaxID=1276757 RepID=UPI0016050AE9|nr:hypothetical protein [Paracoccus siganidrum]
MQRIGKIHPPLGKIEGSGHRRHVLDGDLRQTAEGPQGPRDITQLAQPEEIFVEKTPCSAIGLGGPP